MNRMLTLAEADEIETEMRVVEADPVFSKTAMRLFMQHSMPCGHAAGNLLTCDAPPFGCVVCNGVQETERLRAALAKLDHDLVRLGAFAAEALRPGSGDTL